VYIKSVLIKNFKPYGDDCGTVEFNMPDGETPGSGLNILVGENNTGKSSLFEALEFVRDAPKGKKDSDLKNKLSKEDQPLEVDITFAGKIASTIENFAQKNKQGILKKYIFQSDGIECLRIRRSSATDIKEVRLWDSDSDEFRNETGIDAPIKKLFELNSVWADTNPQDEAKLGATTICGKLLGEISKTFEDTPEFEKFQKSFRATFNDEKSGLRPRLADVEKRTQEIFESQYGKAEITFHFEEQKPDVFFKKTRIMVNDGIDTYLEDKGTGMQRSVALALVQVYAENLARHKTLECTKPFFLLVDEPETCLHPQGQTRLLLALLEIAKTQQVFIATHSPYFVPPELVVQVLKFTKSTDYSVHVLRANSEGLIKDLQTKENRLFFLRHRNLFFTDKAIFIEGVDDYERYTLFCEENGFGSLPSMFFMMNGYGPTFFFEEFCMHFGIRFVALVDHDFSFTRTYWQTKERQKTISSIEKYCQEKSIDFDAESFRAHLADAVKEEQKGGKWETVEHDINGSKVLKVKEKEIFVLRYGEVRDYLEADGSIVAENKEDKSQEVKAIFSSIAEYMA